MRFFAAALLCVWAPRAWAGTLLLEAFDADGKAMSPAEFLAHIAPQSKRGGAAPEESALLVTDLYDTPAGGRPWLHVNGNQLLVHWKGPSRVRLSLPWPIAKDGFSTVWLDDGGRGYADGARVAVNEAAAETEYRLFRESLEERSSAWEPPYRTSGKAKALEDDARKAMAKAREAKDPAKRGALYEAALTALSAAWAKVLFEHGLETARSKGGASLRWGLTLDESAASRVADFGKIAARVEKSGANWVRLVFRSNPEDYAYSKPRSFEEYDALIAALAARKIRIMGSPLDSTLWPKTIEPAAAARRVRNLVLKYKDTIRSWEVASEINGTWLGGAKEPLPEEVIFRCVKAAAAEVKRIDPSLETAATLYWWEGTAKDDLHPTFAWLRRTDKKGLFEQIDLAGLAVYPDENPMGLAFDTAFHKLQQYLPSQRLMLSSFGYVEGKELEGYWWLDPKDVDGARKDLLILYTGASASLPHGVGGGFWWPTLTTMMPENAGGESLFKIYRRTLDRLGR